MPVPDLPVFEETLEVAGGQMDAGALSECHGAACGLLSRDPDSRADAYISLLATLELAREPGPELAARMISLFEATLAQLQDEQFRFALWLPSDDESLEDRTEALAYWCTGYLAALGAGQSHSAETLSEEVSEALSDLQQIAQAEVGVEGDGEEEEAALVEIVEYVRVVILMMREELRPPQTQDSLH